MEIVRWEKVIEETKDERRRKILKQHVSNLEEELDELEF